MERNKDLKENAQRLRKEATKEENLLWYNFLRKYPLQFRRQYIIGNYIADFYCHKAKLVVELDGSGHFQPGQAAYDEKRTEYLKSQGLCVLRFSNLDILRNFVQVCEAIDAEVKRRLSPSLPAASK